MTERTRQVQSSIDRLPDDVREKLQELLRDPRVTQLDATAKINEILEAEGHPDRLSKSSVNRYAMRMEDIGKRLRQSREVADMWVGKLGAAPQGKVGHLLNEMVRTLAFEAVLDFSEGDEKASPKMLKDLAVAVHRLERAASENVKREGEIRSQAIEDAADVVEETAKQQGLNEEQARFWREQVLGVR